MLVNNAGETTFEVVAEGATAPEPLRHTDRVGKHDWRAGPVYRPGPRRRSKRSEATRRVNLSGTDDRRGECCTFAHAKVVMSEIENPAPLQIPLHNLHNEAGARFGTFAGYDMPMRYEDGAVAEHEWCRNAAALFDVSHMGVIEIRGDERALALESVVPAALS